MGCFRPDMLPLHIRDHARRERTIGIGETRDYLPRRLREILRRLCPAWNNLQERRTRDIWSQDLAGGGPRPFQAQPQPGSGRPSPRLLRAPSPARRPAPNVCLTARTSRPRPCSWRFTRGMPRPTGVSSSGPNARDQLRLADNLRRVQAGLDPIIPAIGASGEDGPGDGPRPSQRLASPGGPRRSRPCHRALPAQGKSHQLHRDRALRRRLPDMAPPPRPDPGSDQRAAPAARRPRGPRRPRGAGRDYG